MTIQDSEETPQRITLIMEWLLKHRHLILDGRVCTIIIRIKDSHITGEVTHFPDITN